MRLLSEPPECWDYRYELLCLSLILIFFGQMKYMVSREDVDMNLTSLYRKVTVTFIFFLASIVVNV
jgi:hypothetical protein